MVEIGSIKQKQKNILESVLSVYGNYDANYLELLTHSEPPWRKAREKLAPYEHSNQVISSILMRKYYGEKQAQAQKRKREMAKK